jgi:hypothetical protein
MINKHHIQFIQNFKESPFLMLITIVVGLSVYAIIAAIFFAFFAVAVVYILNNTGLLP